MGQKTIKRCSVPTTTLFTTLKAFCLLKIKKVFIHFSVYLDGVVELSSQVLPQLVFARNSVQDKVRHVGGTVASEERSAKVGHAGLGVVLHQLGAGGHGGVVEVGEEEKKRERTLGRYDLHSATSQTLSGY